MNKKGISFAKIISWIFIIIAIIITIRLYQTYKKHYFGDFIKAGNQTHVSKFYRDNKIKYSKYDSYKIESENYNDAVFYKEIEVIPNTPYRVTCMVKTENVIIQEKGIDSGAMICLIDSTEVSKHITGTNDWQELTFIFNSENRESVKIGFRLGGNSGKCKGTAWFSDFKLEKGIASQDDSEWNVACFIFKNINIENERITMSLKDVENIKLNMQRFASSCKTLSKNKMSLVYDIYEIEEPITTLTYNEEHNYHITPKDVKDIISDVVLDNEYDHVIVAVRMGDGEKGIQINVGDWIGLRGDGTI